MSNLIAGLDFETTGLSQPEGDRIVEVALLLYDLDTRELVDKLVQTINPERPIPSEATRVHGYTYEMLATSPTIEEVMPVMLGRVARTRGLIIHNAQFDLGFLVGEALRLGHSVPSVGSFCTMENGRWATFDGKYPNLRELCVATGVPYDASLAHKAEYDTDCMMTAFFRGFDRGAFRPDFLIGEPA